MTIRRNRALAQKTRTIEAQTPVANDSEPHADEPAHHHASQRDAAAAEGGKSLTAELESMVRRNPISCIAAAFVVGIILGGRGRRY